MAACVGTVPLRELELLRRKDLYRKDGRIKRVVQNLDLRRRHNGIANRRSSLISIFLSFLRRGEERFAESATWVENVPVNALIVVSAIPVLPDQVPARLGISAKRRIHSHSESKEKNKQLVPH